MAVESCCSWLRERVEKHVKKGVVAVRSSVRVLRSIFQPLVAESTGRITMSRRKQSFKSVHVVAALAVAMVLCLMVTVPTMGTISSITVTSPNGGEHWSGTHNITWTTVPVGDLGTVSIYLVDGGSSSSIVTNVVNNGSYPWDTASVLDSTTYIIKVVSYTDANIYDSSDAVFEIDNTAPTGTVVVTPALITDAITTLCLYG